MTITTAPVEAGPKQWRRRPMLVTIASLVGLATMLLIPAIGSIRLVQISTLVLIYMPLAVGQNLITGNSGQISFAHAAFWGIGAYTTALLTLHTSTPHLVVMVAAFAVTAALGLLTGLPAIKISGDYLFIVTVALNFIFLDVVSQNESLGGSVGLAGIPRFSIGGWEAASPKAMYFVVLVAVAAVIGATWLLTSSRFGKVMEAVRDDPIAAVSTGINPTPVRVAAFAFGAGIAGVSGALLAHFLIFVGPGSFGVDQSLLIFEMVIIGGLGTIPGSILGAILLIGLPELLRPLQDYRLGLGGLAAVIMMIARPQGLLGRVTITRRRS